MKMNGQIMNPNERQMFKICFPKNIKRKKKRQKSQMLVSTPSSETILSSKQTAIDSKQNQRVFPVDTPSLAHETLSNEKLKLPVPGTIDLSKTQYSLNLDKDKGSSEERLSLTKQRDDPSLDSRCQTSPDSQDVLPNMSSESTPTSPESESPQLDQLLSDLEEMKLKFKPETTDPPLESTEESTEVDQDDGFLDQSLEHLFAAEKSGSLRVNYPPGIELAEDHRTDAVGTEVAELQTTMEEEFDVMSRIPDVRKTLETSVPSGLGIHEDSPMFPTESPLKPKTPQGPCEEIETLVAIKSQSDPLEKQLSGEDMRAVIPQTHGAQTSLIPSCDVLDKTSTDDSQDLHFWEPSFVESYQSEDASSLSLSDLTPETVTTARHFSFDELMPFPSSEKMEVSDEDRPKISVWHSEDSLTPSDYDCFASQSASLERKPEMTSSTSDEENNVPPPYSEACSSAVYTSILPEGTGKVHSDTDSPTFEYSDPEPFFDCKQAESDFSETEPEETKTRTRSIRHKRQDHLSHLRRPESGDQRVLLSSGSEDYEDAPFILEPLNCAENEELQHYSDASDEEFLLCEASQSPPVCESGPFDETDKSLAREITAELGSMSENSDEEFLTTRIVRRRVVIQADELPDLPAQSVTEERYRDENGHVVVKKVTRKIIRKCVSADGVEHEESLEGTPEGSNMMAEGAGYSKVVKRTVVKSEGDETEVTFGECEGFSSSRQETPDGCKVSHTEKTTVVEGERTMTQRGDPSLASDLPSAQDDFKQALGFLNGFSTTELPRVVERKTVREDGTVVRRARVCKGRTLRRTVVTGAGPHKQVLQEQVDSPRKGSKPHELRQHLHQLFQRYYDDEKEDNDEDEDE